MISCCSFVIGQPKVYVTDSPRTSPICRYGEINSLTMDGENLSVESVNES